jgi:hypothetical protein
MKILHDWDDPYLKWKRAALIGFKYLLYSLCTLLGIKLKFNDDIHNELRRYAETLAKLDKLVGVEPIFGIRDLIEEEYPEIKQSLSQYNVDIRKHIHIGEDYKSKDRKRIWKPPLNQPKHTWHYDTDYVKGREPELNPRELPIWHVDKPYYIKDYIDFLYERKDTIT